jgi:hypothetical protein
MFGSDVRESAAQFSEGSGGRALPSALARLAGEGYVPGLGAPDPSVGTYTTLIAAFAVNELLARLFGYGGGHPPSEMLLRLHDRYISSRSPAPRAALQSR